MTFCRESATVGTQSIADWMFLPAFLINLQNSLKKSLVNLTRYQIEPLPFSRDQILSICTARNSNLSDFYHEIYPYKGGVYENKQ